MLGRVNPADPKSDQFDEAMGKFALAYSDQAERDHGALKAAVRDARHGDTSMRSDPWSPLHLGKRVKRHLILCVTL